MSDNPGKQKNTISRLVAAFGNSLEGLKHGFQNEAAIRLEILLIALSIPCALVITLNPLKLVLLWGAVAMILIV